MKIPKNWTFKDDGIAKGFNDHVREQLPWYDLMTQAVVHFGRHYIPNGGIIYDIGASTGNIGNALREVIESRKASLIAIEESKEMVKQYTGGGEIITADVTDFEFQPFDFGVVFLVLMFIPIAKRGKLIHRLIQLIKPGGCMIIIDKIHTPSGYYGTVARRLTMQMKMDAGANAEAVIEKELSLAGYQRPIDPLILSPYAKQFFQLGEFAGWIIEARANE